MLIRGILKIPVQLMSDNPICVLLCSLSVTVSPIFFNLSVVKVFKRFDFVYAIKQLRLWWKCGSVHLLVRPCHRYTHHFIWTCHNFMLSFPTPELISLNYFRNRPQVQNHWCSVQCHQQWDGENQDSDKEHYCSNWCCTIQAVVWGSLCCTSWKKENCRKKICEYNPC